MELPRELLDTIFSCIDRPSDLLALAVASKEFHNIIVPNHLDHRLIRCDRNRLDVWRAFIENPHLARRILNLEIVHGDRVSPWTGFQESDIMIIPSLPGNAQASEDPDGETVDQRVNTAVGLMRNLECFEWTAPSWPQKMFLDTLCSTCPDIREVTIDLPPSSLYEPSIDEIKDLSDWPVWNLGNLTKLSFFHAGITYSDVRKYVPGMNSLAHAIACQKLQDLRIRIDLIEYNHEISRPFRHTFQTARWPNLRHLDIPAYFLQRPETKFFESHTTLESVRLSSRFDFDMDFVDMPTLKSLETTWNPKFYDHIPPGPRVTTRLEHLKIGMRDDDLKLLGPIPDDFLLKHARKIKSLVVALHSSHGRYYSSDTLKNLVYHFMDIERLALFYDSSLMKRKGSFNQHEIASILEGMPNLTHFYCVELDSWDFEGSAEQPENCNDKTVVVLRVLSSVVPTLKFVAIKTGTSPSDRTEWMTIERGPDGSYTGHTPTPYWGNGEDLDINRWGSARVKRG